METVYLVEICQHNGKTGTWNYKQTKFFNDLSAARKEFHNQLGTYIDYGDLDHVAVILWDNYANRIDGEFWHKPEEPEPESES